MEHIAIMNRRRRMIPMILSGDKVIESRWMARRTAPWGKVYARDTVYFKNSGEPVTACAIVDRVTQFEDLDRLSVRAILDEYGVRIGISDRFILDFYEQFKNKRYCVLVLLRDAREVVPFDIDKSGFGVMCAWISVEHISMISR